MSDKFDAQKASSIGSWLGYEVTGEKNIDVGGDHIGVNFCAYDLPFDHHEQLHITVTITRELTRNMLDRLLDVPELAELAREKLNSPVQ
jgi:hypothetical protein